jgi:uncharacterized damage-inducible protein DinB
MLLAYSEYMRERYCMAILEMKPSEFVAPLELGWMFGSIRDLFVHMVETEEEWVRRVQGQESAASGAPAAFPDAASVVTRWEEVRTRTRQALGSASDADLDRLVETPFAGHPKLSVRQIFMHLLIHEVHHRGQITAAMRMRGVAPPPSDLYDYIAEQLQ